MWSRAPTKEEIAENVFLPVFNRRNIYSSDLVAYVNFENPDSWVTATETGKDKFILNVPELGPHTLNATTANIRLVPSRDQEGYAALLYDEDQKLNFFPTVPDGEYVGFVAEGTLKCLIDVGCQCENAISHTPVQDNVVEVLLPPGTYRVCHSKSDDPLSLFVQPNVYVESSILDACFGISCGAHGRCQDSACVCDEGYIGDLCQHHLPLHGSGKSMTTPAASCEYVKILGLLLI